MSIPFGLSPFGFRAKRLNDIKTDLDNQITAQFGDVNLNPQSVMGQLIGVTAKVLADIWENLEQVYFSQYPNTADGVALDNVVQYNGITRIPSLSTVVIGVARGDEGTFIPAGSLARILNTENVFASDTDATISSSNAYDATVESSDPPIAQAYNVIINNKLYVYSRPTINFANVGNIFVSGNIITVFLNGIALPSVNFTTNSNNTLTLILNQIKLFPTVDSSTTVSTNPNQISIFSVLGQSTVVTAIVITGGATQATYTITYTAPPSMNAISERLSAMINTAGLGYTAQDLTGGTFKVTATNPSIPFSLVLGNGMTITDRASPIVFSSNELGPIPAPENTLTNILTPIAGWASLTNPLEGVLGRFTETDAQLRLRRLQSLRLLGRGTVEAIRAHILAAGALSASVFENVTLLQEPSSFSLSTDLVGGDSITVELNGISQTPIAFSVSHLNTMQLLAIQIQSFPGVSSAVVGGTGNRTITMTFTQGFQVTVDSVIVAPSSVGVVILNGIPPKSFEAVVQGQTDEIIANAIWYSKPAGIQSFGNTQQPIIDSQGQTQQIFFSRPQDLFIWVQATLTLYPEETFPANGLDLVKLAINNYINGLGVGVDVLLQRVQSIVFTVPGIASSVILLAATFSEFESPSYASADIPVSNVQVAVTELALIQVVV